MPEIRNFYSTRWGIDQMNVINGHLVNTIPLMDDPGSLITLFTPSELESDDLLFDIPYGDGYGSPGQVLTFKKVEDSYILISPSGVKATPFTFHL